MRKIALPILLVASSLTAAWLYVSTQNTPDIRTSIGAEIARYPELLQTQKNEMLVMLSVEDFVRNQGHPPTSLSELVPKYFDTVPVDPTTKQPVAYKAHGNSYTVGTRADAPAALTSPASGSAPIPTSAPSATSSVASAATVASSVKTFDLTSKRDPFQPPNLKPKRVIDESRPELERYEISDLRLTAIFAGVNGERSASVENTAGRGFMIKKGVTIGVNQGKVIEIQPDKIIIEEQSRDSSGAVVPKTVEMLLRTKTKESLSIRSEASR